MCALLHFSRKTAYNAALLCLCQKKQELLVCELVNAVLRTGRLCIYPRPHVSISVRQ